jgi:uncharacterized iron-regulated protein
MKPRYLAPFVLFVLVLLAACAHDTGLMKLEERLTSYGEAVRWGLFERAADFQTPNARAQGVPILDKDIHISGYDPVYRHESEDGKTVNQTVEISYFREQTGVVRKITDRQTWSFDKKKGQWFLDTPIPAFSK